MSREEGGVKITPTIEAVTNLTMASEMLRLAQDKVDDVARDYRLSYESGVLVTDDYSSLIMAMQAYITMSSKLLVDFIAKSPAPNRTKNSQGNLES